METETDTGKFVKKN